MADRPRRDALIVATATYQDERLRPLKTPLPDAAALARVLRDPRLGGFTTTRVTNRDAHVVQQAVDQLFARRSPEDTVLLYFSGHGLKDDAGRLYVAARNTTRDLLASTAISDSFLRDVMAQSRARRQILILDCCFGGAFSKALIGAKADDRMDVIDRFPDEGRGRVILTASTALQFAFESDAVAGEPQLSVFTKVVVDGLRTGEADIDGDRQISVQDLYDFTHKRLASLGSNQTPTISNIGQEGQIFVASVPALNVGNRLSPLPTMGPRGPQADDLSPWLCIRDTGAEATNPAMAAVMALETAYAVVGENVSLSVRYVHEKARNEAEPGSAPSDIRMADIVRVLEEFGAPSEQRWPYRPDETSLPNGADWAELDEQAGEHRARMTPIGSPGDIAHSLAQRRPVLATFAVYESTWMSTTAGRPGWIDAPAPGEPQRGQVAVTIVRYEEAEGVLHFAHTWGPKWGDAGFGSMSLETARLLFQGEEMWAVDRHGTFRWSGTASEPLPVRRPVTRRRTPRRPAAPPGTPRHRPSRRGSAPRTGPAATAPGFRRVVFDAKGAADVSASTLKHAVARAEGDPPTGVAVVDETYDGMGEFHRFFWEVFERDSIDGHGLALEAVVHYGRGYNNAFWDGTRLILGDGDGTLFLGFSTPDVIGHELTHGFLQHAAPGLGYDGLGGALQESLADVFGSMVKQYTLGQRSDEADWIVGQGVLNPQLGSGLRSLSAPGTAYDNSETGKDQQVGHLRDVVVTASGGDNKFVNSGVPSHAFYLAALELGGYSWERVGRAWYDAVLSDRFNTRDGFEGFARLTVQAADRPGSDGRAVEVIREAWRKVGVQSTPARAGKRSATAGTGGPRNTGDQE